MVFKCKKSYLGLMVIEIVVTFFYFYFLCFYHCSYLFHFLVSFVCKSVRSYALTNSLFAITTPFGMNEILRLKFYGETLTKLTHLMSPKTFKGVSVSIWKYVRSCIILWRDSDLQFNSKCYVTLATRHYY